MPPESCPTCNKKTLSIKTLALWDRDWFKQRNIPLPDEDGWTVLPEPSVVPVELWGCDRCYWQLAVKVMR
jgi:hypothetical protein